MRALVDCVSWSEWIDTSNKLARVLWADVDVHGTNHIPQRPLDPVRDWSASGMDSSSSLSSASHECVVANFAFTVGYTLPQRVVWRKVGKSHFRRLGAASVIQPFSYRRSFYTTTEGRRRYSQTRRWIPFSSILRAAQRPLFRGQIRPFFPSTQTESKRMVTLPSNIHFQNMHSVASKTLVFVIASTWRHFVFTWHRHSKVNPLSVIRIVFTLTPLGNE